MLTCNRCKKKVEKLTVAGSYLRLCRSCNTERYRRYRQNAHYRNSVRKASNKAYLGHKEKWLARAKVKYAVKAGKLTKPTKCEVCEKRKHLEGHHPDYSKPLEVMWLCTGCHADVHASLGT